MYKLIIVDDEKAAREAIASLVNWAELEIEVTGICKNGMEAYDMLLDDCPDIVLTDIMMPGMSGLDLIARAAQAGMNVSFIILSGYGEFEFAKKAMQWGIKHYLLKPCNAGQIRDVIRSVCAEIKEKRSADEPVNGLVRYIFDFCDNRENAERNTEEETAFFRETERRLQEIKEIRFLKTILVALLFYQKQERQTTWINEIVKFVNRKDFIGEDPIRKKIMEELADLVENRENISYANYIDAIMRYVDENLDKPELSLRWLAENYLFMSADYLSHQFLKQTGEKFSAYLTRKRVEKAQSILMSNRNIKIYEVAEAVGCGDYPQYFSQIFKNRTGCTPSEFQKQMI
ncbi:MAG: response regulator [Lachnospiraceae bacterium]|nr:response regulator [Lachnospiraceae bacterium]